MGIDKTEPSHEGLDQILNPLSYLRHHTRSLKILLLLTGTQYINARHLCLSKCVFVCVCKGQKEGHGVCGLPLCVQILTWAAFPKSIVSLS